MKDDIMKRLRNLPVAADEIERLRAEIERLTRERDYLTAGIADLIDCQSPLPRSAMRDAAASLLDKYPVGRISLDKSPFVQRAEAAERKVEKLQELLLDVTASLTAAHSLLKRGGKKAAPSDKMFEQMLLDYEASADRARAALAETEKDRG